MRRARSRTRPTPVKSPLSSCLGCKRTTRKRQVILAPNKSPEYADGPRRNDAVPAEPFAAAAEQHSEDTSEDFWSAYGDWDDVFPASYEQRKAESVGGNSLKCILPAQHLDLGEDSRFLKIVQAWRELRIGADLGLNAFDFTEGLRLNTMVVEALGAAFRLIQLDTDLHCNRITTACNTHHVTTIQQLTAAEHASGPGTDSTLWMKRNLQFTFVMISEFLSGRGMPECAEFAYRAVLHDCHPYFIRKVARAIRVLVPSTEVFCARIDPDARKVREGMRCFVLSLRPALEILVEHYNAIGVETVECCREAPGYPWRRDSTERDTGQAVSS